MSRARLSCLSAGRTSPGGPGTVRRHHKNNYADRGERCARSQTRSQKYSVRDKLPNTPYCTASVGMVLSGTLNHHNRIKHVLGFVCLGFLKKQFRINSSNWGEAHFSFVFHPGLQSLHQHAGLLYLSECILRYCMIVPCRLHFKMSTVNVALQSRSHDNGHICIYRLTVKWLWYFNTFNKD